jgi:hypothetical protein
MTSTRGPWSFDETRRLVRTLYGEQQEYLLSPSLDSLDSRQRYAGYHLNNFERLVTDRLMSEPNGWLPDRLVLAGSTEEARKNQLLRMRLAAEATACAASLHALLDTLAHAVTYSLGMNLGGEALTERQISLSAVQQRLSKAGTSPAVAQALDELDHAEEVTYLEALVNHSKHRSVIRPGFAFGDFSGLPSFSIEFEAFSFRHSKQSPLTQYGRREVKEALVNAHGVISPWIVGVGHALLDVLSARRH